MARRFRWSILALILAAVWVMAAGAAVEAQPGRYTKSPDRVIEYSVTGLEWDISPNRDNLLGPSPGRMASPWPGAAGVCHSGGAEGPIPEGGLGGQYGSAFSTARGLRLVGGPEDPQFAWGFAFYSGLEGFHSVKYGFGRVALAVRSRR